MICKRLEFVFIAAAIAAGAAACQGASAALSVLVPQKGVGAPYGARDPYTCSSTTTPKTGAITVATAEEYAICGFEHESNGFLYLVENVNLQVGRGVVPRGTFYIPKPGMDPKAPVYALRGTYDWYQCGKEDPTYAPYAPGKNCSVHHEVNGSGSCARTTFGDWKCNLEMGNPGAENKSGVAPPKG